MKSIAGKGRQSARCGTSRKRGTAIGVSSLVTGGVVVRVEWGAPRVNPEALRNS